MRNQLLITFDVEDFINPSSIDALHQILELLEKCNLRALFFITGHMAEKLPSFPKILRSLEPHEIGFHSSGHSVHPTIFEYCDVERYEDAFSLSIKRETGHINPLSGKVVGNGGICALRNLFLNKKILSYRAPGYCCPPPHLEAMAVLGIKYDFSWNFSQTPVYYRGITFYPRPIYLDCEGTFLMIKPKPATWMRFLHKILVKKTSILNFHPHVFVSEKHWDSIYHERNPLKLETVPRRENEQTRLMFTNLETLFKTIRHLEKLGILKTDPILSTSKNSLDTTGVDLDCAVDMFAHWPRTCFDYEPKYILPQLSTFLEL